MESRALVPVLVLPDWHGNGTFAAAVADRLARLGFFAFCVDMFGKGVRPATAEDAAKNASAYLADGALMRDRVAVAARALHEFPNVDTRRVRLLGFSFGGRVAIEATRMDLPIEKTVLLWSALNAPGLAPSPRLGTSLLLIQGAKKLVPFVSPRLVKLSDCVCALPIVTELPLSNDLKSRSWKRRFAAALQAAGTLLPLGAPCSRWPRGHLTPPCRERVPCCGSGHK